MSSVGAELGMFSSRYYLSVPEFFFALCRKTTTMLYKMLLVEASSEPSTSPTSKSRQLFVTQSRILADKVGEHFAKLLGGYLPSAVSENIKAARRADRALVDIDEENDWRSDLPKKYSDLQDTDFPLFVSFDQVGSNFFRDDGTFDLTIFSCAQ